MFNLLWVSSECSDGILETLKFVIIPEGNIEREPPKMTPNYRHLQPLKT